MNNTFITNIGIYHYLLFTIILFLIGYVGVVVSKNIIKVLLCIQILINAVCVNLAAIAHYSDGIKLEGVAFIIFIIMTSFVNMAIVVAIIINMYKHKKTVDIDKMENLKG